MSQGSRPNYAATIAAALAGEQAAYTTLYDIVLIMAKHKIVGDRALAQDAPWLTHEATAHVLLHLHQCGRPAQFTSWAFHVIGHYYQRVYQRMRYRKNRMMTEAEPIDDPQYKGLRQIIYPKDHAHQLEAHIDATYTLARLPARARHCAINHVMYGQAQTSSCSMTYVRKMIRCGDYHPDDKAFRLPGMVM